MAAARRARLRYVNDALLAGIRRVRHGKNFLYVDPRGKTVRDKDMLKRIRSLVIPPSWTEVWICPYGDGHIQATGRDARGRKQYRYHHAWRTVRDQSKFLRLVPFADALARIRIRMERDLQRPGLPREKVLAAVVRLLELTHIRIGNEEYAVHNKSFGLTTLWNRHVKVEGSRITFDFRGKSGKDHSISVTDRRIAHIVRECRGTTGRRLFRYIDKAGHHRSIESCDVNGYLRELSGTNVSAKDYRTWKGTVIAALALAARGPAKTAHEAKRAIVDAIRHTSEKLGNTIAVCKKYYIHPAIFESYLSGVLHSAFALEEEAATVAGLHPEEQVVLRILENHGG